MTEAKFIVDCKHKRIKATTVNSAYQLFNESIVIDYKKWPLRKHTWYPINGSYGEWVLTHEFPNYKGGEFIKVEYI